MTNEPAGDDLALRNPPMSIMDFEAIKVMPADPMELVTLYGRCGHDLHLLFRLRLTQRELELLGSPNAPKDVVRSFNEKLENFAVEIAEQIGAPFIYFDPLIANLMLQWRNGKDKDGIRKLKRFHKAIELGAEVRHGKKPATVLPQHYAFQRTAVLEIKPLLPELNRLLSQAAVRAVTIGEVCSCAETQVKENPESCRLLTEVLTSFLEYLEHVMKERIRTKKPFYDKLPTATQFVRGWMAWSMKRTEKGLRWAVSTIGNQP